jgi:protein involved in polysaccharide export with SLBB domain
MKLSEAIINAGGFKRYADDRRVHVTRANPSGGTVTLIRDLKEVIKYGHTEKDLILQPEDHVWVPKPFLQN